MSFNIAQHINHESAPREANRAIHRIDPTGYEIVEERPPKQGDLFADERGPAAWIWRATNDSHADQFIVRPT